MSHELEPSDLSCGVGFFDVVHVFVLFFFLLVERLSLFDSCRRQLGPSILMMME